MEGTSYTFFTPSDFKHARDLIHVLNEANQTVNPELYQFIGAPLPIAAQLTQATTTTTTTSGTTTAANSSRS